MHRLWLQDCSISLTHFNAGRVAQRALDTALYSSEMSRVKDAAERSQPLRTPYVLCRHEAQAPMAAVASLIQQFEGRALHPELLQRAEQGHEEQPSDVEKPHTPPKRETPLVPLQRYPTFHHHVL